jgi:hypothetical protein
MKYLLSFIVISSLFTGCAVNMRTTGKSFSTAIHSLHLLGTYEIPWQTQFAGTTIGGLSGIDYDAGNKVYYLISDDRSAINPARYYTAAITFSQKGIDSVSFLSVTTLRQPNGQLYPALTKGLHTTPDPEAIRYNSAQQQWVWSSEGERIVKPGDTTLIGPAVYITNEKGVCIDSLLLPACLQMQAIEKGPRQNSVLEGLAFSNNFRTLFASMEEPLFEDGPRASMEKGGVCRIFQFNLRTHKSVATYIYPLDPIAHAPTEPGQYAANGISEMLAINAHQLLVIERSFTAGIGFTIKLFLAELKAANNRVSKKLLLDMTSLNLYIDNVEGVTFGPALPNGHRTLILVTDNNFNKEEKTQFFAFEVL